MKTKEHSIAVRDLIIQYWKDKENGGFTIRSIANAVKVPRSTVNDIISRYKKTANIENATGRGRKSIFTNNEKKLIIRKVKKNPRISAPEILADVSNEFKKTSSVQTIRNILHEDNYKGVYAKKKPYISQRNKSKRLAFARQHLSKDQAFWDSVLWSDESRFNVFGSDGRRKVWRKPGESLKLKNLNPTVKHGGGGIMVWGCMSSNGAGKLEIIEGIMNQEVYQNILSKNLKQSAAMLRLDKGYLFQQDNDPKHKSKSTTKYLEKNKIYVLQWPPQSPDLNPIEHLWDHIDREIRKHNISSKAGLQSRVLEAWDNIDPQITRNLVESMERRLLAVIAAKGGPTRY